MRFVLLSALVAVTSAAALKVGTTVSFSTSTTLAAPSSAPSVPSAPPAAPSPTVGLDYAKFTGKSSNGIDSFLGMPFAQPPYVLPPIVFLPCRPYPLIPAALVPCALVPCALIFPLLRRSEDHSISQRIRLRPFVFPAVRCIGARQWRPLVRRRHHLLHPLCPTRQLFLRGLSLDQRDSTISLCLCTGAPPHPRLDLWRRV